MFQDVCHSVVGNPLRRYTVIVRHLSHQLIEFFCVPDTSGPVEQLVSVHIDIDRHGVASCFCPTTLRARADLVFLAFPAFALTCGSPKACDWAASSARARFSRSES